jgi:hypothetical protein
MKKPAKVSPKKSKNTIPSWLKRIMKDQSLRGRDSAQYALEKWRKNPEKFEKLSQRERLGELFGWGWDNREYLRSERMKVWRERAAKSKETAKSFARAAKELKQRMPKALVSKEQKAIARSKLLEILQTKPTTLTSWPGTTKPAKRVPQRFENLAKVKARLSKPGIFRGEEAMLFRSPFAIKEPYPLPRKTTKRKEASKFASGWTSLAEDMADWSRSHYSCRVFYSKESFSHDQQFGTAAWGHLREGAKPLAVQIFDPDPKALLDFAKVMAKRRKKDPIAILDLYGRVFYP